MKAPTDKDSVIARYMEGPALLRRTLADLDETDFDRVPAEGGWTVRQIVHHLVDGDDLWKVCIKQALGNEQSEFSLDWYRAFEQDTWADNWAYQKRSIDVSLSLLEAIRNHVFQLLEHVPDGWNKSVGFREPDGEVVRIPVGFIVEMQADHVDHHLKRILAM
jgi:hypothetical protein